MKWFAGPTYTGTPYYDTWNTAVAPARGVVSAGSAGSANTTGATATGFAAESGNGVVFSQSDWPEATGYWQESGYKHW